MRGATERYTNPDCKLEMISIHAPREGSDPRYKLDRGRVVISIHAPREGSDYERAVLSTLDKISIHAPREGSDREKIVLFIGQVDFNPRSP